MPAVTLAIKFRALRTAIFMPIGTTMNRLMVINIGECVGAKVVI